MSDLFSLCWTVSAISSKSSNVIFIYFGLLATQSSNKEDALVSKKFVVKSTYLGISTTVTTRESESILSLTLVDTEPRYFKSLRCYSSMKRKFLQIHSVRSLLIPLIERWSLNDSRSSSLCSLFIAVSIFTVLSQHEPPSAKENRARPTSYWVFNWS